MTIAGDVFNYNIGYAAANGASSDAQSQQVLPLGEIKAAFDQLLPKINKALPAFETAAALKASPISFPLAVYNGSQWEKKTISVQTATIQADIAAANTANDFSRYITSTPDPTKYWEKKYSSADLYYDDFYLPTDTAGDDTQMLVRAHSVAGRVLRGRPGRVYAIKPSPAGVGATIIPVLAGQKVLDASFKIANGAGTYRTIFGGGDSEGFVIDGCTFDHNQANNNIGAVDASGMLASYRASFIGGGADIRLTNNIVKNSQAVNDFYVGVGGALAIRPVISRNKFLKMGQNPGNISYDQSVVYVSGEDAIITDNFFQADWTAKATTAIESHCTRQHVMGNKISGYLVGMNVTGITVEDTDLSMITHNTLDVKLSGVNIWSAKYLAHITGYGIKNTSVSDNIINIRQATYAAAVGANAAMGIGIDLSNDMPIKDLTIRRNKITFEIENADPGNIGSSSSSGIGLRHTINPLMECENFIINDNEVYNAPIAGIGLSAFVNVLEINDNLLVNCGQGKIAGIISAYKKPFFLDFKSSKGMTSIAGNRIVDTFPVTRTTYAFTCFGVSGVSPTPHFVDNTIDIQGDGVSFISPFEIASTASSFLTPLIKGRYKTWTAPSCNLKAGSEIFDETKAVTIYTTVDGVSKISASLPRERAYVGISTDVDFTIDPFVTATKILHAGTLTANRIVTFPTVNMTADHAGLTYRVTRIGGGAFTLTVGGAGGTRALTTGQWADVTWHGSVWYVSASGSL
jgi:hypothetical protein